MLGTERQIGMATGPIPHSAITQFVETEMGLVGDHAEFAINVILELDKHHMALMLSRLTKSKKGKAHVSMKDPTAVSGFMKRLMVRQSNNPNRSSPLVKKPRA